MEKLTLNATQGYTTHPRARQADESSKEAEGQAQRTAGVFSSQSRAGVQNSRNSSEGSDYDASSDNNTLNVPSSRMSTVSAGFTITVPEIGSLSSKFENLEERDAKPFWRCLEDVEGLPPTSRNCHSATAYGRYLIIFGGREGDGSKKILNDVFILDTEEERWIQPEIIGEQPNPRMGHTAQLYNNTIIIHGGWDGFKVLDDLVFIELQSNMEKVKIWTLEVNSNIVFARQFHTASIIDDKMFVFGGGDGKYWLNDLLIFHLKTYEWEGPVETKGRAPSGRLQHAAIVYDKKIFIFGGEPDRYRQLNDLFYLDIRCQNGSSKMTWYQPQTEGIPPTPRVSATGCLVNSEIYFFGGFDGMRWLNDLHTFCLKTMTWSKKLTFGNKPSPRCRHSTNYLNSKLFIFGGNDCDKSFNSIYTIKLPPPSTLRKDLRNLFNDELFSDVTFVLEGVNKINAHRAILASRCDVFRSMFTSSMQEGIKNEIEIPDTNTNVFRSILNYIYTDEVEFCDLSLVVNLLIESNKYNLIRLKRMCEWELTKIIDHDNVVDLLHLSDIHGASDLRDVCLDYAVQHFEVVTKRKDFDIFKKLSKNTIVELLKRK